MNKDYDKSGAINSAIAEQAFHWLMVVSDEGCSAQDSEDFIGWLKKSPVHIKEFMAVEATWGSLDTVREIDSDTINTLLDGVDDNVRRLGSTIQSDIPTKHERPKQRIYHWFKQQLAYPAVAAIAGIFMVAIALTLVFYNTTPGESIYSTAVGEQRTWTLDDGSVLHLNTASRIKIDYSEKQRLILLLAGEALFDVAHDANRPFYVRTKGAIVRAVGTSFNVYHRSDNHDDATVVTVVEGKVAVSTIATTDTAVIEPEYNVDAGNQLTVKPSGEIVKKSAPKDIETATAWRKRELVFRSTPLIDVIVEFNRYNRQKIIITSQSAGSRDITGVFDPTSPNDLLLFLERDKAIKITRYYDKVVIGDSISLATKPLDSK